MAEKFTLLRHLRSISIAARDFTNSLIASLASSVSDAIDEVANELPVSTVVTLTLAGWSGNEQTVTVNGVTSTNTIIVSPDPVSQDAYATAEVFCTEQTSNALTFTCTTVPTDNLTVNLVIIKG